jgi:starvation-inducible DNA-binding protein
MNQLEKMNQYVADLSVLFVRFHNLHWNVVGEEFKAVHEYLELIYDDINLKFDEVAERIKMMGEYPLASLKEYLEVTQVEELESKDISIKGAYQVALDSLELLKQSARDIRKLAEANDDFVTVSMMEDHITSYDKEIWFVRSALK